MATKQPSDLLTQAIPVHYQAGVLVAKKFTASLVASGLAAADILELGCLPAGCKLHRAEFTSVGIDATATLDVGIMSGVFGDAASARTMNATGEIVNDGTKNTTIAVGPNALDAIGTSATDRGIGVKISADEAAGASQSVTLYVEYYKA